MVWQKISSWKSFFGRDMPKLTREPTMLELPFASPKYLLHDHLESFCFSISGMITLFFCCFSKSCMVISLSFAAQPY